MQYFIVFLEGIITFISPCLLPMLPVYISYFAGGEQKRNKALKNALGFVLGFTAIFVAMGALAGTIGALLIQYRSILNIITGLIVIFFGLSFMGVFSLSFFKGSKFNHRNKKLGFFSSIVFGMVFSIGWTPCVGTFLGSALMLASTSGNAYKGILMLLCYSMGLGIPFIISALLIDSLKGAFGFIKRNYNIINTICGIILIIVGVLMASGVLSKLLSILA